MHHAEFSFTFSSPEEVTVIYSALIPEMKQDIQKMSITLFQDENTLVMKISTSDTSTLRAACNSYLRWIQTAHSVDTIF